MMIPLNPSRALLGQLRPIRTSQSVPIEEISHSMTETWILIGAKSHHLLGSSIGDEMASVFQRTREIGVVNDISSLPLQSSQR
jgi:hypothetical protein